MADFGSLGLRITRLAVSPAGDRIALVSDDPSMNPQLSVLSHGQRLR
ncbi:MAG: hypothetical protein L0271_17195 [Gemmatimonadetes bacterium]|nr:hypothetical protein [Gemmatimonadota bacterium]